MIAFFFFMLYLRFDNKQENQIDLYFDNHFYFHWNTNKIIICFA